MGLPFLDSFSAAARHGVWHADELGSADAQVIGTGHAALDAELPGGGWPVGAMTELLQTAPQDPIWPLLLPGLVQAVQARGGPVVLIGAPCEPFGASLAAHGLAPESLMWVRSDAPAARLWACEQALRCADVGAVLAWLPQARVGELRRLQLAAAQHEALLFVCRPETVAQSASPARLRLHIVRSSAADAGQVALHILKRRGPPLATPVMAPARSERMSALLAAARVRRKLRLQQGTSVPEAVDSATVVRIDAWKKEGRNALDRIAVVA